MICFIVLAPESWFCFPITVWRCAELYFETWCRDVKCYFSLGMPLFRLLICKLITRAINLHSSSKMWVRFLIYVQQKQLPRFPSCGANCGVLDDRWTLHVIRCVVAHCGVWSYWWKQSVTVFQKEKVQWFFRFKKVNRIFLTLRRPLFALHAEFKRLNLCCESFRLCISLVSRRCTSWQSFVAIHIKTWRGVLSDVCRCFLLWNELELSFSGELWYSRTRTDTFHNPIPPVCLSRFSPIEQPLLEFMPILFHWFTSPQQLPNCVLVF